jgi:hypothetical protein
MSRDCEGLLCSIYLCSSLFSVVLNIYMRIVGRLRDQISCPAGEQVYRSVYWQLEAFRSTSP